MAVPYPAAQAQDAAPALQESHSELKADKSLQFELAEAKAPDPIKPRKPWDFGVFGQIFASLVKFIFYGILALLVATVVFYIVREIIHVRFPPKAAKPEEEEHQVPLYAPDEQAAQVLLDDVDRLAAEGRYDEAVHTLLFRSIQDIEDKRPHSIKQSFTSREIAGLDILTPDARSAFSQICAVVERSFFGKRKLTKADFETCRDHYAQFATPKVWA